MKKTINFERGFAAKWWNPLFWLFVLLAPAVYAISTGVWGLFCGLLFGLADGLGEAHDKLRKFNSKLP